MAPAQVTDDVYSIDIELFDTGVGSVCLVDDEEPTLIDAGTATSADRIQQGLADCGVAPSDLQHLVLTHIHVDHSGAAGALVEAAPDLNVYIHELTAPHLTDPSDLIQSSRRAMGEHFDAIGEQAPVPEERVVTVPSDGTTIDIGDTTLELLFAPGHSPDHFAVWNPERDLLFASECLGSYLPRADRWIPPATVPNFDLEQIEAAIDRLQPLEPEHIVFPHCGPWPHDPAEAFERAERELHRFDERILDLHEATESREATKQAVAEELIDIAPPYAGRAESFYASLITDGYLQSHDIE